MWGDRDTTPLTLILSVLVSAFVALTTSRVLIAWLSGWRP